MMEYKRLTFRHKSVDGTEQIGYTEKLVGCYRKEEMILNRLAELEDKIESKRLREMPCNVGDCVYLVIATMNGFSIVATECTGFMVYENEISPCVAFLGSGFLADKYYLTYEEAKKRLEELKETTGEWSGE